MQKLWLLIVLQLCNLHGVLAEGEKSPDVSRYAELLQKISQNLRPMHTFAGEFIVESSTNGTDWRIIERTQIQFDNDTDSYKIESIIKTQEKNLNALYRQEAWDGSKGIRMDRSIETTANLDFTKKITGSGNAAIFGSKPAQANPFFLLQKGYFGLEEISKILGDTSRISAIAKSGKKNEFLQVSIDENLLLAVDPITGAISSRKRLIKNHKDEVAILDEINVSKSELVDGRFLPVVIEYISGKIDGNKDVLKRVTFVEDSIKINTKINPGSLSLVLPVGCLVTDNIENTIYTASEVNPLSGGVNDVANQLDLLLEKANAK